MSEWISWIKEVAAERVDSIERGLRQNPDAHPDYAKCARQLDDVEEARGKARGELVDALADAWLQYSGALAVEMYLAGARDGGRLYHALTTGKLNWIQERQENTERVKNVEDDHAG